MTKSQPGLYELLRQRSLRSQMSQVETYHAEPEPSELAAAAPVAESGTASPARPEEPSFEPASSASLFDVSQSSFSLESEHEVSRPPRWYEGSLAVSTPVGIAISLLAAVLVFAGYQLGYSRGRAAEAPALWSNSGGAEREAAAPAGTIIAVRAAAFEDLEQAFHYAKLLNESGRFVETAQVVEPEAGGAREVVIGSFESQSEAERSGLLEKIRGLEVQDGDQAQKPFGKAELRVYSLGD